MSKRRPILTPAQYRERTLQLRVEVANVMWSLVVSPAPVGVRRWRALTPEETEDVFSRLAGAIGRHSSTDTAQISDEIYLR